MAEDLKCLHCAEPCDPEIHTGRFWLQGAPTEVSTQDLLGQEGRAKERATGESWDGFPEEVLFELGPKGQAGVCQAEHREGCYRQKDGVSSPPSGHVSNPECSEQWVWHVGPGSRVMLI